MVLLVIAAILVPTTLAASRGHVSQSTRNAYNDRRAPRPVQNLDVQSADASSVRLDWSRTWDNVGVEGYGVYLDGSRKSETSESRYTLRDLACGRGYTVGVDAFDDAGNRSRKTSTVVSTSPCRDVSPPSVPTDVHSVASTENAVILAWTPSTDDFGVVGYSLYVGGFWVGRWNEPSATITNLSCGQTYQIGIEATDAAGNESARSDVFFSTARCSDHKPPAAPGNVGVTKATQTSVSLGWTASTDPSGIAEYGLYRDGAKVGTASGTTGDFGGLQCGKTYSFGVDAADNAQNRSAVASLTAATATCSTTPPPSGSTAPSAPPNLHTASVDDSTIVLRWDSSTAANGMAGYQIFRDGAKIGEGPGVHGGLTNQWTDRNADCGAQYRYAVAGVDTKGTLGPKAELSVSTPACETPPPGDNTPPPPDDTTPPPPDDTTPPPPDDTTPPPPDDTTPPPSDSADPTAPPNLHTFSVSGTTVVLRWDSSAADNGMAGYQIFRDGKKIGEGPGVHGGLTNQWTDRNATCDTRYRYAVAGVDTKGNLGPKSELIVSTSDCESTPPPSGGTTPPPSGGTTPPPSGGTTPPPPPSDTTAPSTPTNVAASTRTETSIALAWKGSTDDVGVTGYGLYLNGSRVSTSSTTTGIFSGLKCGTNYTLAVDAVDAKGNRSQQAVLMVATSACPQAPPPPPPPPPSGGGGTQTISASDFRSRATAGATISNVVVTGSISLDSPNVTVQNATIQGGVTFNKGASGSKLINSKANHVAIWSADNILLEGNTFDGGGQVKDGITMWDQPSGDPPTGWVFRNNTFQNFYIGEGSDVHSQAIYVGYSTNGLIEGNTFTNNGTTSHIFFTWFGGVADPGSSWPRNICVRNNTFNNTHGAYYDVNFRSEIPSSSGIVIERDASSTSPQFYGSC
jgi:chitodextrinase